MGDVAQKLTLIMSQEGEQEVSTSLKRLQGEVDKTAKSQSGLTKFVKEQRQEQRLQNYLFRESAGAALVLANALGGTSKSAKELKNSINAGFATFQGFSFMLAGFPPMVGLAVGAIGGLIAAMMEQSNALDVVIQRNKELRSQIHLTTEEKLRALNVTRTEALIELAKIQRSKQFLYSKGMQRTKGVVDVTDQEAGYLETVALTNRLTKDTLDDVKQIKVEFEAVAKVQEVKWISDEQKKRFELAIEIMERIKRPQGIGLAIENAQYGIQQAMNQRFEFVKPPDIPTKNKKERESEFKEINRQWQEENALLTESFQALGDVLRGSLGGAFEDVFGEANSLLEKFGQRLFEILAMKGFGSLLSLIPGVGGFLSAAVGGGFGGPNSPVSGGGVLERQLADPTFQRAFNKAQSNRVRLGKAA